MRLRGYDFHQVGSILNDPLLDVVNGVILHVDGGNASSLISWFDGPSGGIESHAFIPRTADHPKEQYRDTNREADANYKANSWIDLQNKRHGFVSVETQGLGSGKWSAYQIAQIKDLIIQVQEEHDFPFQVCKSYHGQGIGYHTLFPEWTNVSGKTCPGPERIKQFKEVLVPWIDQMREQKKQRFYVTKAGDNVPSICDKFKIPQWQLWRWNPTTPPPFVVGTRLRVH